MCKIFKMFKKPKAEGEPSDEMRFQELGVDWTLYSAFTLDRPLTYEEYVNRYVYDLNAAPYRGTPHYDEYLRLFKKYKGITGEQDYSSDSLNNIMW